ncbi:TolB family protein [Streptomyces sp. NBC_01497]|uniref:TolB family protein n=1 Tax=Streptomyces sp. NBC_01497 TaxID=2903885 RepID=UPI002E339CBC|nr:TolB-like translocation protein [Streptomyces sp. NBC_01497]
MTGAEAGAGAPAVRGKVLILVAAVVVLSLVAGAAVLHAGHRAAVKDRTQAGGPPVAAGPVTLGPAAAGRVVFRNMAYGPHRDELSSVPAATPGGKRTASGMRCLRFYAAGGTGICLQAVHGPLSDSYRAVVLDSALRERARYPLPGIPTRARVSPSGHLLAWTVFVGGDSYAGSDFSTRTGILDTRTGALDASLESYRAVRDGQPVHASDINYWGVTFADDRHFYATMGTGGRTYLVRGDIAARTVTTVRTNVECPSLSPDGTRIAFKKRVPGLPADAPWRLYVLDLRTGRERALAEPRSVDDQVVWPDDHTVVYAMPSDYGSDLYTLPADGTGAPRRLMTAALAPAYLR